MNKKLLKIKGKIQKLSKEKQIKFSKGILKKRDFILITKDNTLYFQVVNENLINFNSLKLVNGDTVEINFIIIALKKNNKYYNNLYVQKVTKI